MGQRTTPVPLDPSGPPAVVLRREPRGQRARIDFLAGTADWNSAWETGHLRSDYMHATREQVPERAKLSEDWEAVCERYFRQNVYLGVEWPKNPEITFEPLYQLMPMALRRKHGLPILPGALWPISNIAAINIPNYKNAEARFSAALAEHLWPYLLGRRSNRRSFSINDPIRTIAHEPQFWMAPMVALVYRLWNDVLPHEDEFTVDELEKLANFNRMLENEGAPYREHPVHRTGLLWFGDDEAADVTQLLVEEADRAAGLRGIIDAVRRNRVQDDFSSYWTQERMDFERALHHRRAKVEVAFVEIPADSQIYSARMQDAGADPAGQVTTSVMYDGFLTLLDATNRRIVVLLRRGYGASEIAAKLNFANPSPVSKRLKAIRSLCRRYFFEENAL